MASSLVIEPLGKHHDKTQFTCGEPDLDHYIKEYASQDVKRRTSRVFIASIDNTVAGFYSLSALSVSHNTMPPDIAKKLPKYPVPAVLLGRLAVDTTFQGKGIATALMVNAMKRVLLASNDVAMYALFVDAKNKKVKAFYQKYGFMELQEHPMRLFLPVETIAGLV